MAAGPAGAEMYCNRHTRKRFTSTLNECMCCCNEPNPYLFSQHVIIPQICHSFIPLLCLLQSLTLCFHHDNVNKVDRMDYPDSNGSVPALRLVCCSALFTGGNHSLSLITLHHATSIRAHSSCTRTHPHIVNPRILSVYMAER